MSRFNHSTTGQHHRTSGGQTYRLFAVGADGLPGTADDIYPVLRDSLAPAPGLLPPPARESG